MKKKIHEEQKLVTFLKQYRPVPPGTNNQIEEQLMTIVAQGSRPSKSISWLWVVPSAIATGLLLVYGSLIRDNFVLRIAKQTEDLETFMVNSWQGSIDENFEQNDIYSLETDWLMLTKTQISSAQP